MEAEPFYELAKTKLGTARSNRVKCLTNPRMAYNEDIKEVWPEMTRDERGWYVLFTLVDSHHDWEALQAISPTAAVYAHLYKTYHDRSNAFARDIVNVSVWENWVKILEARTMRDPKTPRRVSKYSARDIQTDYSPAYRGHNPRPGDVRLAAGEALQDNPEGWVRPSYW